MADGPTHEDASAHMCAGPFYSLSPVKLNLTGPLISTGEAQGGAQIYFKQ